MPEIFAGFSRFGFGGGLVAGGLCGSGLRGLLLRYGGGGGLIGFLFLMSSFGSGLLRLLLHAFGVGLGGFGLCASLISFLAALDFGSGVRASPGFAVFGGSFFGGDFGLRVFFGLLLHSHDASFFGGADRFARGGFDGFFVALASVHFFGVAKLQLGFGKSGSGVLVGQGDARDSNGIARFEKFERCFAVDTEDGVFDFGVGGRIDAAAQEFEAGVDVFHFAERGGAENIFENDGVARLVDREIRFSGDEHAEGLHVRDGFHFAAAVLQHDFAEIHGAALRRNRPQDVGEILETELGGVV